MELGLRFGLVSLCGSALGAQPHRDNGNSGKFATGPFSGLQRRPVDFAKCVYSKRPGHEGSGNPLTQKCGTAQNGLSLNEQANRPGRPISPDRCRCEGSWSQEVADGSDRCVREERPSGG